MVIIETKLISLSYNNLVPKELQRWDYDCEADVDFSSVAVTKD